MSDLSLTHKTVFSGKYHNKGISFFSGEELDYIIDFLKRYNSYVDDRISITPPDINNDSITPHDQTLIGNFPKKPEFYTSLNGGGRVFSKGGYQNISGTARAFCEINRQPLTGYDMSASSLQFLQILGETSGISNVKLKNHPEDIDPYNRIKNDIVSALPGVTLTRETIKQCIVGIIYPSKKDKTSDIDKKRLGNMTRVLEGNPRSSEIIEYLMDALLRIITHLETEFQAPIHIQVWKAEAQYLYAVLEEVMNEGLHVLPVHDAYISPISEAKKTREILDIVSHQKYQKSLHFHEGL